MQPSSPPLSPSSISRFSSPCALPDHLTAALLVLVNKPDTHFYPVFHVQKDPPPDISGLDTMGRHVTAYDQIILGSDIESDLRMFFAEPKHCSLVIDALGQIYVLNFSSSNPCLLNSSTLDTNTLHSVADRDVIHVAGKDFRVEYKSGYPMSDAEATHEDTATQISDTIELPEDSIPVESPPNSPLSDKMENISYSLPKIETTPTPQKSGTVPHDTTDNSYASMEVNTSQPSLVVRDMSTFVDSSPRERRRVSDPPKVPIQSPIKLKRRSAPVPHTRTPRSLYQPMDTSNESPAPRRSHRLVKSPTPPNRRSSPRHSTTMQTPKQFPPSFKHPHSTSNSAKKSKSPLSLGHRKSVRFGPSLSPEEFCRDMPPSTPVKRGGTPILKSATKAVLRRSTPYKVPLPLSAQRATRATKSTSPDDSLKTPKFSLSSPKQRTPKSLQTLSPVREAPQNPSKPLVNQKPMLRRGFTSGVVAEMAESQSFKLSSRISTPTSLHSKQPNKLLDRGTSTIRAAKVPNLVSAQSFVPKSADLTPRLLRNTKSPEAAQETPKRKSVSFGNQTGQKESPKLQQRSPRLNQGNSSGELEFQIIQRQSPRLSKSPVIPQSPNPNNLTAQSESPFSPTRSPRIPRSPVLASGTQAPKAKSPSPHQKVPTPKLSPRIDQSNSKVNTPTFLSKSTPRLNSPRAPGPSSQRRSVQISRTSSAEGTLASPRVSSRISGSPDTLKSRTSPRPNSQMFSPRELTPNGSRSPADFYKPPNVSQKSPAVNQRSPAVNQRSPAVIQRSPAVNQRSPAVNQRSPAVNQRSPAVIQRSPAGNQRSPAGNQRSPVISPKSPAVSPKSPAVIQKSPAVDQKSPAGNQRSPAVSPKSPDIKAKSPAVSKSPADFYKNRAIMKSPIVISKTPAVSMKFSAVTKSLTNLNKFRSTKKSPAVFSKSPADKSKRLRGRPRKSAPALLSSQTPVLLRSHVSPANSPSPPLLFQKTPQARSPVPRMSPRLAWVSPTRHPQPRDVQGRFLQKEDLFNPNIFLTPKSKNRTSQAEANFSPSLFDTPKSPRGSKRSISAPPDTYPATLSQSKRSRSLPVAKEPRKKNTAVPEDTFVPYLFRTPRTKPVRSPIIPEDHFSPGMFRTPPTPLLSPGKGLKRTMSQRGRKPTKQKRGNQRITPDTSPLPIRDASPSAAPVERPRQLLKRGVSKKATSSPAKVVIISSPPKPPATQKLDSSPFVIQTRLRSNSPSPIPMRVSRGRPSKQKKVSAIRKPTRTQAPAKLNSPEPKEVLYPSPVTLRGNRQRYVSSKPIILNKEASPKPKTKVSPPKDLLRVLRVRSKKLSPLAPNTTRSILKTPSKRQVFSSVKNTIDIPISPIESKLRNPRKTGRNHTATVAFATVPPETPPIVPVSIRRSNRLK